VRFQVAILSRDQIIKMISQGQYDIGIIGAPPQNDLFQRYCVWMDRMVLITPDTPFFQALSSELPLAKLLELPLITRNLGNTSSTLLDYALKEKGLQIKQNHVILDSNNNETVMHMVSHGLGAAIVSLSLAKQTSGIRIFELEDLKLWRNFYAIYLQVDYYPPYFAEFLKYMPSLDPKPDNPLDKHAWEL
jgi:DNA-binding transcriptional LysR family regulator